MRTNRYASDCAKCGKHVPADGGTLEGPPYRTLCTICLPRVEPGVRFEVDGDRVKASLSGYLGNTFSIYRQAVSGWKYSHATKSYSAPASDVPTALKVLKESAVPAYVDDAVNDLLTAAKHDQEKALEAADGRAADVDSTLAKHGHSLYPYQRTGIRWLAPRPSALLADDMGLGKTLQALTAAPSGAPILVVCPAVAKGVWVREAAQWRSDLLSVALKGRKSFRWPAKGEMVVVNYDILPPTAAEARDKIKTLTPKLAKAETETKATGSLFGKCSTLLDAQAEEAKIRKALTAAKEALEVATALFSSAPNGLVFVADEAHAIKNPKAARTKRFRAISKATRHAGGAVWLLTGTPLLNRPPELWALLTAANLAVSTFGSFPAFAKLMGGEQVTFRAHGKDVTVWEYNGRPAPQVPDMLRTSMLRRLKEDVLEDLPALRYESIDVNGLSASLKKACDEALAAILPDLEAAEKTAESTASLDSIPFELISKVATALAMAKTPHLLSMVEEHEEADEPLVVFSAHRAPVDALANREGWAVITGDTSPAKRTEAEEAFQAGKLKGVAATIQAGGVAITLTRASRAIFVDRLFTPALNQQARDRIYRIGQDRGVLITDLVAEHALDRRLYELLATKEQLIADTVDAARVDGDRDVAAEELALLSEVEASDVDAAIADYEKRLEELSTELDAEFRAKEEATERVRLNEKITKRCGLWNLGSNGAKDTRRSAKDSDERFAEQAVRALTDMDPDHAAEENEAGWNKADGYVGHALAMLVEGGLTEAGWRLARNIVRKYHRQVGELLT